MDFENLNEAARWIRNEKLKETDHWGLTDFPSTQEQRAYRQALRDLPSLESWPELNEGKDWPVKPE